MKKNKKQKEEKSDKNSLPDRSVCSAAPHSSCAMLHSLRSKRVFPVFVLGGVTVTVTEIQCLFILMQIRM
jgi:hypothetical protein